METLEIKIHEIAVDGPPGNPIPEDLVGRVAFIFDGCIVSGWPLSNDPKPEWEADSDVGHNSRFREVTHWVEFPIPIHRIPGVNSFVKIESTKESLDLVAKLERVLKEIEETIKHQEERLFEYGDTRYGMVYGNGSPIFSDLFCAKANVLIALANLKQMKERG